MRRGVLAAIAVGVFALASTAGAATVLTFEGLGNLEPVQNYYNGGLGGFGSGPGPSYGAVFSGNALALIDADAGGTGNIGGEPSPNTALIFLSGQATTLNYAAGFDTGFSFYYSAPFFTGAVRVYDGLDATGSLLATLNLGYTPNAGAPDPTGQYSPFVPIGVTFGGIAKSIDFAGTANYIAFDDITFGSATPGTRNEAVPEPGTMALLGTGLVGLAGATRRRMKK